MDKPQIIPEKITKPIQLLGAWLAGLFSIDSCFLVAASRMDTGSFESYALVIAAILNVPIFLIAVFLLQTKFRPELQEDSYYATYLNQKTNEKVVVPRGDAQLIEATKRISELEEKLLRLPRPDDSAVDSSSLFDDLLFGINKNLPDVKDIKAALKEHGVVTVTTFGTDELPKFRTVSMSSRLSSNVQKQIIHLAGEMGFSHYNFITYEENVDEDVLFGGYGDPEFEIL